MANRIVRSYQMMKQSGAVLAKNPQLFVFSILSAGAYILLIMGLLGALFGFEHHAHATFLDFAHGLNHGQRSVNYISYILLAVFYFTSFFIGNFFNTALVACVLYHFQTGKNPTISMGLNIAMTRIGLIAQWSLIGASVGLIFNALERRAGIFGAIVIKIIGMTWAIASYFVVPVLVLDGLTPMKAIQKSGALVKRSWGEGMMGATSFGIIYVILTLAFVGIPMLGLYLFPKQYAAAIVISTFIAIMTAFWVLSVMSKIYGAAVFVYANTGKIPAGFDQEQIVQSFH